MNAPMFSTARDQDVEVRQALDNLVCVSKRCGKYLDLGGERTPVGEAESNILVVVEDSNSWPDTETSL